MTEHFTREEAVALASTIAEDEDYEFNLINNAITAKQKEWEAQGAVGQVVEVRDGAFKCEFARPLDLGTKLYTHALPAQPAEPVNADLISAAERVSLKYGHDDDGTPSDWTEWKDLREAISRAQAAQPVVAVPEAEMWVPDMEHLANEWADAATNGPSWLSNVHDGICTYEEALEGMKRDFAHCREVGARVRAAAPQPQQKEGV